MSLPGPSRPSVWSERLDATLEFARSRSWSGHDPYDALKSRTIGPLLLRLPAPFGIALTQVLRRSPIDFRSLLAVPSGTNPKAIALFLSATARAGNRADAERLAKRLLELRSPGYRHPCWGYDFPWQARAFFLPAWTPTVVVTSFAGEALLDAHALLGDESLLEAAVEACRFVREDLHRSEDDTGACLSYSPLDRSVVYNASVLGARLLTLVGQTTGNGDLIREAGPLFRYALARQCEDGSWAYGAAKHHRWIDSFHTGFVLSALDVFEQATGDAATASAIERGGLYYRDTFFGPGGEPYYFAHRRHPFDIHSAAQAILTSLQLAHRDESWIPHAKRVGRWLDENMLGADGRFAYQVRRTHTVWIPYMRWSQAWGVRALAELVRVERTSPVHGSPE